MLKFHVITGMGNVYLTSEHLVSYEIMKEIIQFTTLRYQGLLTDFDFYKSNKLKHTFLTK